MKKYLTPAIMMVAAGLTLASCNKKPEEKAADLSRAQTEGAAAQVDVQANTVENKGEVIGGATEKAADSQADALHSQADAIKAAGEKKADAIEKGNLPMSAANK
jgi:hypothetical protein